MPSDTSCSPNIRSSTESSGGSCACTAAVSGCAFDAYGSTVGCLAEPGDWAPRLLAEGLRAALPGDRPAGLWPRCFRCGLGGGGAAPPAAVTNMAPRLPLAEPLAAELLLSGLPVRAPGEEAVGDTASR